VKKFLQDIVARSFALIAPVWRVLQQVLCSSETVPNAPNQKRNAPKQEFRVQWCGSGAFVVKKFLQDIVARTFALITLVWRVLQQVLCCSETVPNAPKKKRNAPKQEFRVQWCGLGALFVKNSDKTSWHELLH